MNKHKLEKFTCLWVWQCLFLNSALAAVSNGNWQYAFSTFTTAWFAWLYYDAKYGST